MKPAFINTGKSSIDFSDVTSDQYNLEAIIRACDSPYIVLSKGITDLDTPLEKAIDLVSFIVRTFKDNKLVYNTVFNKAVFEANLINTTLPDGVTLNDFMLISARELLTKTLYPKYDTRTIALNAIPTPFGITKRDDGTHEALFQIVVNHEILTELNTDYSYTPVLNYENDKDFHKVYQQFKFTKEGKND